MELLPVAAALDGLHHQVLRGQEGHILPDGLVHHLFVDPQAVCNVLGQAQNGVGAQKALGHGQAAVGRVVQGALHPLDGGSHGSIHGVGHEIAAQGADALTAHGVALIGHGRRADLVLLKGLLQLTVVLQQADVVGHAVDALSHRRQAVQNPGIYLPGVGLAADGEAGVKAEPGSDAAVHLVNLCLIALKEIHEAGLGAGGAPAAQKAQAPQDKIQLLQV